MVKEKAGDTRSKTGGGFLFYGVWFLVMLGAKLTGISATSWFWVCMPIWGPLATWLLVDVLIERRRDWR